MNVATTAANNLPKSNNLLVFGGGFIFLVLLAVGLYFALRKKEGDECKPEDSEKVSYAGEYKIDKDGKCKIATCALGYNLTNGSCEADMETSTGGTSTGGTLPINTVTVEFGEECPDGYVSTDVYTGGKLICTETCENPPYPGGKYKKVASSDGSGDDACIFVSCNEGWAWDPILGKCIEGRCEGTDPKGIYELDENGNCNLDRCRQLYYKENDRCVAPTEPCEPENRDPNAVGYISANGECIITSCAAGYTKNWQTETCDLM